MSAVGFLQMFFIKLRMFFIKLRMFFSVPSLLKVLTNSFAHSFFCHGQKKRILSFFLTMRHGLQDLNHWTTREVPRILKSGKLQEAEEALLVRLTCNVRLSWPLMALKTNKGQGKWAASRNQKEQGHGTSLRATRKPRQQVDLSPGKLKSDF